MSESIWTDEEIQRAVESWIDTPGDLIHCRLRAALDAVPAVPRREYEALIVSVQHALDLDGEVGVRSVLARARESSRVGGTEG